MTGQAGLDFRGLLRQLRDEAGLTQEELAGAARVSQRAVSDLERGINRTARKDTALLLAGALGLDGQARERFVAAARGHARAEEALAAVRGDGAGGPAAASRTLPRDIPAFTGRQEELEQLMARWAETGDGRGRRGGGHPCDRRDGRDRQDDYRIRVRIGAGLPGYLHACILGCGAAGHGRPRPRTRAAVARTYQARGPCRAGRVLIRGRAREARTGPRQAVPAVCSHTYAPGAVRSG